MFGVIRLLFGVLLLIAFTITVPKFKIVHNKRYYFMTILLLTILISVTAFFPIENTFVTFKTPQAAYKYYSLGQSNSIFTVVEGEKSDLVIATRNNSNSLLIIPKGDYGWKVGLGTDTRIIAQKVHKNAVIYIYEHRKTGDYYIAVINMHSGPLDLVDVYGTDFQNIIRESVANEESFISYYAGLPNFEHNYWIRINGDEIVLS